MTDILPLLTVSIAALGGLAMLTTAGLAGWRGWLDLQRSTRMHAADMPQPASAGARIELADLRERIRKLEAIAAGIDL
jgi:hypothetical protein